MFEPESSAAAGSRRAPLRPMVGRRGACGSPTGRRRRSLSRPTGSRHRHRIDRRPVVPAPQSAGTQHGAPEGFASWHREPCRQSRWSGPRRSCPARLHFFRSDGPWPQRRCSRSTPPEQGWASARGRSACRRRPSRARTKALPADPSPHQSPHQSPHRSAHQSHFQNRKRSPCRHPARRPARHLAWLRPGTASPQP